MCAGLGVRYIAKLPLGKSCYKIELQDFRRNDFYLIEKVNGELNILGVPILIIVTSHGFCVHSLSTNNLIFVEIEWT